MKEEDQQRLIGRACDLLAVDISYALDAYASHAEDARERGEGSMMSMDMLSMLSTFANLKRAQ